MDIKLLFTLNILILVVVSTIMMINYKKNPKNDTLKYLTYFIVLHFIGFIFFVLRNQVPDFLSIIVANTLFAVGTICIYLAIRSMLKKEPVWHNRYFIPIFIYFLGFVMFTYIDYDTKTRILIYYSYCAMFTFSSAWLLWTTETPAFRFFDKSSAVMLFAIALIFIGFVLQATVIRIETYYFSNKNIFMILSIIVMDILSLWTLLALKYRIK